ncbi:MAG: CdaR family protein [Treponema sp.]|nr:CdaR family protein [Treponema sp.]
MNSKKLLAAITDKWPAKVLSVAAALFLMLFHRMSNLETRFYSSPLQIETGTDLIPASPHTRVIKVGLRGEANVIRPVFDEDIEPYIDLKKYTSEGWYQVPVQVRRKGSAVGIEGLEISVDPAEISLRVEEKISRSIPVRPVFRGTVADGYELAGQSFSPAGIFVEGPRGALELITGFQTDYIDLEGRSDDFSVFVYVINHDPFVVIRGNGMTEFRGHVRPLPPVEEEIEEEIQETETDDR